MKKGIFGSNKKKGVSEEIDKIFMDMISRQNKILEGNKVDTVNVPVGMFIELTRCATQIDSIKALLAKDEYTNPKTIASIIGMDKECE